MSIFETDIGELRKGHNRGVTIRTLGKQDLEEMVEGFIVVGLNEGTMEHTVTFAVDKEQAEKIEETWIDLGFKVQSTRIEKKGWKEP